MIRPPGAGAARAAVVAAAFHAFNSRLKDDPDVKEATAKAGKDSAAAASRCTPPHQFPQVAAVVAASAGLGLSPDAARRVPSGLYGIGG